jgi:hypothetical protein
LVDGAIVPSYGSAEWGDSFADLPAVERTGTGTYTITALPTTAIPGSWMNSLLQIEAVVFRWSRYEIDDQTPSYTAAYVRNGGRSGNVLTVKIYNAGSLSDLGGGVSILVEAG